VLAAEGGDAAAHPMPEEHVLKIRDLRLRFGAPEMYAAHCSCGWMGDEHRGRTGERMARRDGRGHVEAERAAGYPARTGSPAAR
jgi:hypothetical protein